MQNLMCALMAALFIAGAVCVAPAEERLPDSVQCGDALGPGGVYFLNEDLNCDVSPALTVLGETHLNLNGHTLNCEQDSMAVGIQLEGEKASVTNGKVVDCYEGVLVGGSGMHHISRIEYTGSNPGTYAFIVESDGNRLVCNSANKCEFCFEISSHGNWLFHNSAFNGDVGFFLIPYASENRLFYKDHQLEISAE